MSSETEPSGDTNLHQNVEEIGPEDFGPRFEVEETAPYVNKKDMHPGNNFRANLLWKQDKEYLELPIGIDGCNYSHMILSGK